MILPAPGTVAVKWWDRKWFTLNSIRVFPVSLCNGKQIHLSLINNSPVTSSHPTTHSYPTDLQKLHPGRVLPPSQPARAESDSEPVTAFPTRHSPSVSTDRPDTGSDRIWVRSFANTAKKFKTLGNTISYIPELRKEVKNPRKYNLMHSGTAQRS
jgi:hypothetical protein